MAQEPTLPGEPAAESAPSLFASWLLLCQQKEQVMGSEEDRREANPEALRRLHQKTLCFETEIGRLGQECKLRDAINHAIEETSKSGSKGSSLLEEFSVEVINRASCLAMSGELEDGTPCQVVVRLFGIPVVGTAGTAAMLPVTNGFTALIRKAGLVPEDSRVALVGTCPINDAMELLLAPDSLVQTVQRSIEPDSFLFSPGQRNSIEAVRTGLPVIHHVMDTEEEGGYVILGVSLSILAEDASQEAGIDAPGEDGALAWEQLLDEWWPEEELEDRAWVGCPKRFFDACVETFGCQILEALGGRAGREDPEEKRDPLVVVYLSLGGVNGVDGKLRFAGISEAGEVFQGETARRGADLMLCSLGRFYAAEMGLMSHFVDEGTFAMSTTPYERLATNGRPN